MIDRTPRTVYEYFAHSARAHPGGDAVRVAGRTLTYAQFDDLVGRLANALPERSRIALLCNRSLLAYAGYLAILRRGGTVVPLNPKYPAARLATMLELVGAELVVCDSAHAAVVPDGAGVMALSDADLLAIDGPTAPVAPADRDDIAYILFTSGTTGRPKGVPIRHRNLIDFVGHNITRYGVRPGCRLSQTFELTFDPSVFDMFVAWGGGATLVVPDDGDLFEIADFVTREAITHWYSVPGLIVANETAMSLAPDSMPGLRFSLFAGEQLGLGRAAAWRAAAPNSVVENLYGPTELTVTVSAYRLPPDPTRWPVTANATVPIGELYPHLEGRLTAAGELVVRGSQRFDGYLDPDDDVGRFVDDHDEVVGTVDAGSWYRTGDRVSEEAGSLVHQGRVDDQLKLLGQRVELGDIEASLRDQAGVTDAVAMAVPDRHGITTLVALYSGRSAPAGELRRGLATVLPPHMIPLRLRWIEAMPRTTNGKIDRARCRAVFERAGDPTH